MVNLPGTPADHATPVRFWAETLTDGRQVLINGNQPQLETAPFQFGAASTVCCLRVARVLGCDQLPTSVTEPLTPQGMLDLLLAAGLSGSTLEQAESLEELDQVVQDDAAVIALLDAGTLWAWVPAASVVGANHAVLILATGRDRGDGVLAGAYVADPSQPGPPLWIDSTILLDAWLTAGGWLVVARPG